MSPARVHRAPVREPVVTARPHDYADAFEVGLDEPDDRTALEWAHAALDRAPRAVRVGVRLVHRQVLRFRLAAADAPGTVLGWRVATAEPELVVLEASSPLLEGRIVGRRRSPSAVVVTTSLAYRRPAARAVWVAVGPLHRLLAPVLLRRAAARR